MSGIPRAANLRCSTEQTREVRKLFTQRKALADVTLRQMQPVTIPAATACSSTAT